MRWLRSLGQFLFWFLEEFDRNMQAHRDGISMLGTYDSDTGIDKD